MIITTLKTKDNNKKTLLDNLIIKFTTLNNIKIKT